MNAVRLQAAALALTLAACGAPPEAATPVATELGYAIPALNPATYVAADTARIDIQIAPGQTMEQTMGQNSTVRLSFGPTAGTAGNLTVTASYVDFVAFMESTVMPRQEVGADAMGGDFVLSVTPRGEVEQVSGPDLPEEVRELTMGENMFADFFVRLPNRVVTPGESWTDTVTIDEQREGAHMSNQTVVVSTFMGDTTVAGRPLWIIQSTKTSTLIVEGDMQGMSMRNELSGTIAERTLWDPARRLMQSSQSTGTMTGTVSIPGAGMSDIPIDVNNVRSVRLVEGG